MDTGLAQALPAQLLGKPTLQSIAQVSTWSPDGLHLWVSLHLRGLPSPWDLPSLWGSAFTLGIHLHLGDPSSPQGSAFTSGSTFTWGSTFISGIHLHLQDQPSLQDSPSPQGSTFTWGSIFTSGSAFTSRSTFTSRINLHLGDPPSRQGSTCSQLDQWPSMCTPSRASPEQSIGMGHFLKH